MDFLVNILLSPGLAIWTCIGIVAALVLHLLIPYASPTVIGGLVVVCFVFGVVIRWSERRRKNSPP